MKKLTIFFILPLVVFSCKNSEKATDDMTDTVEMQRNFLQNNHLQGEVKSIEETNYTLDENGEIGEMDSCCVELRELDKNGFSVKMTRKYRDGNVKEVTETTRDERGRYVSGIRMANGKQIWKRVVERDADGNAIQTYDSDSTMQVTMVYRDMTFNEYNQAVEGKSIQPDSTYVGTWSFKYIDGQRAGRAWVDSTGVKLVDRTGEVNDKGWVSTMMDERVDENGELVTLKETYTYDSVDEKGNWTQRTESHDGKPVEVRKRTYTYYQE